MHYDNMNKVKGQIIDDIDRDGEYVYGLLATASLKHKLCIQTGDAQRRILHTVNPCTLRRFTGAHDMHGTEIYESDRFMYCGHEFIIYYNYKIACYIITTIKYSDFWVPLHTIECKDIEIIKEDINEGS